MELSVKFVDDDHVWINNKQYISLKRFQHKIMHDVNDVISRKRTIDSFYGWKQENLFYHPNSKCKSIPFDEVIAIIEEVPPAVETTMKLSSDTVEVVRCKDCKHFELDHWVNVNGQPLIVAHEICAAWGGGCKTKPDGYCNMGERKTNGNNTL